MIPPRQWDRLASIYELAKALPPNEREGLLRAQCGGDDALRREVESLLAQDEREGPLDTPLWDPSAHALETRDRLAVGATLGPYRIESLIGRGGMGEVYRARDRSLGRDVALKVLPALHAEDAERLARFEREAHVLATLSHPNIAAIYGLERAAGDAGHSVRALVLELVDGPTLADRLARRPLPVEEALDLARQVADALQAAHDKGIIHRDLKPANIKIAPDGTVKVLDFGLARLGEADDVRRVDSSMSPTVTTPAMTAAGVILGTAAYMSPEQAKGKPADKRSDVWALGCVLYEMLTGKRALGPVVLGTFQGRILNTHPALLPRFGGRGMYGDRVFEAVLEAGEAESGVSIHLVDPEHDTGPIVRQCKIPVLRDDSVDELKARVRAREKEFVVETLAGIATGDIRLAAGAG